jgi:hypothetical protein
MVSSRFLRRATKLATCLCTVLSVAACGGEEAGALRPKLADRAPEQETDHLHGVRATSEVGGLNEEAVEVTFKSSLGKLQRCLNEGSSRLEFLGGSVSFFLKIDASGRVEHTHLESSTLGDRTTERCMMTALRSLSWPKPVGGEVGLARKSFDFDPPNDVRPPTDWSEDDVEPAVRKLSGKLRSCKNGSRGAFQATAYVAADGSVLAASVTPPDEAGEDDVDCLVEVLGEATFPSPGSWPAKVSFTL